MRYGFFRSLGLAATLGLLLSLAVYLAPGTTASAAEESITAAAEQAKASVEKAGTEAANGIETLWKRIDERRLKNRTPDELVGWLLMGLMVGALASLVTPKETTIAQRWGMVGFGLVGSFFGGILAHVFKLNFGLGPVLIRYEDLLLSIVGGFVLILGLRVFVADRRKKALVKAAEKVAQSQ
jgi:uncharacterized membrane protein YeaQ/YmgE (transglycosylase-associated protein family)